MLGFHPLSALELEFPGLVEGALSTAATIAAIPLAHLALVGGQPPASYPELAASLSSDWVVVAPLRLDQKFQAALSGDFVLTSAMVTTSTLRADANADFSSDLARLNLAAVGLFSTASFDFHSAPHTIPIPHTGKLFATPSTEWSQVSPFLNVPAVIASDLTLVTSMASPHMYVQMTLRAAPNMDFSSAAHLGIVPSLAASVSFDHDVVASPTALVRLYANLAVLVTANADHINLERPLASNSLISLSVSAPRPLIISHALTSELASDFTWTGSLVLLPHVPLPPVGGFTPINTVYPAAVAFEGVYTTYTQTSAQEVVTAEDTEVPVQQAGGYVAEVKTVTPVDISRVAVGVITSPQADEAVESDEDGTIVT